MYQGQGKSSSDKIIILWKLARSGLRQGKCENCLPGKGQMKFNFFSSSRKGTYKLGKSSYN